VPETSTVPPLVSRSLPLVGHAPHFLRDQLWLLERGYQEHAEVFRLRLRPHPGRPPRPRADSRVQGPAVPLPDPVQAPKPATCVHGRSA
jgi:hypothetical protein